jgi:hypothetical protein
VPFVAARVEEEHNLACLRINAGNIRAFVVVARKARQAKIAGNCAAAVLSRDDVIYSKRKAVISL